MLVYKGYTISKDSDRGLYQVADSSGNALVLMSLVRECKQFINQMKRAA